MNPRADDTELDEFWGELQARQVPDDISMEEAERRMRGIVAPTLPAAQIADIVARATRVESPEEAAAGNPRTAAMMRWVSSPSLPRAAAVGMAALLVSAGAIVSLWPEVQYSSGVDGSGGLSYRDATLILIDPSGSVSKRRAALFRVYNWLRATTDKLRELERSMGANSIQSGPVLAMLRQEITDPSGGFTVAATIPDPTALSERLRDTSRSVERRQEVLWLLGREMQVGLRCMAASRRDDPKLESTCRALLEKLGRRFQ